MSLMESFEIEVKTGVVRGSLRFPGASSSDSPAPAVLICRGLHVEGDDAAGILFDELTEHLSAADLAVARFEHRSTDLILEDFEAYSVADELDDVQAVQRWLANHVRLDRERIGVIGFGLGAISAAGDTRQGSGID